MDKKRVEIIISGILILVFILVWSNTIKVIKKRVRQRVPLPSPVSVETIPKEEKKEIYTRERPKEDKVERLVWVRCPFSGKIYTSQEGLQDIELEGIIWDDKNPLAMINGRVIKIGDMVSGNRVVDIKKDRVILNDGTRNFEIQLTP